MKEEWKEVEHYPDYSVSSFGNVKRNKGVRRLNNGKGYSFRFFEERILKKTKIPTGYLNVCLYNQNGPQQKTIHRLVANAFIPNPDNKLQVNHKNGIKIDNGIENLEWCTTQENTKHAWKNNLINIERRSDKGKHIKTRNVYFDSNPSRKNYRIVISEDKKYYYFGNFDTEIEATAVVESIRSKIRKGEKLSEIYLWSSTRAILDE